MDQKRIRELEQKISTDYGNTTGVAVLKEGKLVYEKYFKGCTRESQVHVYSVTKSIISILIGINDEDIDIFNNILELNSVGGECGLSNTINTLPVFEDDPLHKKGNLLIQILLREGLVSVDDEYNVAPSIDYHVIRFFLRNGFIKFADETIINRLINGETFELDEITELRMAIADCMKYIYNHANISIAKLGFIAWTVGRDFCRIDYVLCEHEKTCPMKRTCRGNIDKVYRMLKEPESNVGFY